MTSITNAVGAGLVESLARPGGNTTRISNLNEDLTPKLLDHFREIMPRARLIATLGNSANPSTSGLVEVIRRHTAVFAATVNPFEAKAASELDAAFDGIAKSNSDTLLIVPDALPIDLREPIASLTLKHPGVHRRRRPPRLRRAAARPLSPLRLFRETDSGRRQSGRHTSRATHPRSTLRQCQDRGVLGIRQRGVFRATERGRQSLR
jgi:ABC transporter substrate binding protein